MLALVAAAAIAATNAPGIVRRRAEFDGPRLVERVTQRTVSVKGKKATTNDFETVGRQFPLMFTTPSQASKKARDKQTGK